MVKQFTFGLCGRLRKSKLSLVSVNCTVLQGTGRKVSSIAEDKTCSILVCTFLP